MKKQFILILFTLSVVASTIIAQDAKKIMAEYTKVTGGQKNWDKIESMKITGVAKLISQGNMELPFLRIMKKDGKQITTLKVNGMDYVSIAYDGNVVWGSNQQMQPEEKDKDVTRNTKLALYDFPYPGHNWKKNGYKVEYLGNEIINGLETYKIKLTKLPQWADDEQLENILILYMDTGKYVPILTEYDIVTGPEKGKVMKSYLSNYKKVDGCLYPFTVTMKYGEETFQILETEKVEWNREMNDSIFKMDSQ